MKLETTRASVHKAFNTIIYVGYCRLQSLLAREEPIAYTTRREGWGADVYEFGDVAIVTGYAPFGEIQVPYDLSQKYERLAEKALYDSKLSFDAQKRILRKIISDFILEAQGKPKKANKKAPSIKGFDDFIQ